MEEGREHLRFTIAIYRHQMMMGRNVVHEHPLNATSWQEEQTQKLNEEDGVIQVRADQCMLGLKTSDNQRHDIPAMKPTRFSTNGMHLAEFLAARCSGDHAHGELLDGKAKAAGIYPRELCRRLCEGIKKEKDERMRRDRQVMSLISRNGHGEIYIDDAYGKELKLGKVKPARQEELTQSKTMRVYEPCPTEECWQITSRDPIKTRWVDASKTNDEDDANYRLGLYSSTPPIEWVNATIAKVASAQGNRHIWTE